MLKESLLQAHSERDSESILEPFVSLAEDHDFWQKTLDGLAVLGAKGLFRVYKLQRPVAELAVVADSFHLKPLRRMLQSTDRYQVLGLSRQSIRLFEGTRDALDEVELSQDVPRTLNEALGDQLTEPHTTVSSYGGVGGSHVAMHHGHGGRADETDIDTERFFRAVDRAIQENYSAPSGLPLILATLPEHRSVFHAVSHNPLLVDEGIDVNPDVLSMDQLRLRAWSVMEPRFLGRLAALADDYGRLAAQGLASDDLAGVAKALVAGRVATLLIEADREAPGRVDASTGDIQPGDLANPTVDDLLDDLGSLAQKTGAEVIVVPGSSMPSATGIAAIYRY